MKYTLTDLRRMLGGEPICPECGARGLRTHKENCRVNRYMAQIHLWKQASA